MSAATAFRALVRKDLALFVRDRRALVVSIVTPIVIAAFFGFLFGGTGSGGSGLSRLALGIVDQDHSVLSQSIAADLGRDPALATQAMTEGEARAKVSTGKLRAAIILPAGFGAAATRAFTGGADKPPIDLLLDPSQPLVRPMIEGLFTEHVMELMTRDLFAARGITVPFTLATVAVSSGPHYNAYAHSFAGMSVQFILFMGIDAGIALLLMRQQGVWRRLRAAPLSRSVLLGSRVAGTSLIALLILTAVYAVAILVFRVRIAGNVLGFAAVAVAFALLAAAAGLMIAAIGRSVGATRGLAIFAVLILVMLGGAWVPTFLFPEWLQRVSAAVPTRWAVDGFDAMTWRGLPFEAALTPVAVMLGWAALFAGVAVWRFDWEAD